MSKQLFFTYGFCSIADDTIYKLVLSLRPAIPWKCVLLRSREDSVPSSVLVVLSFLCVWVFPAMITGTDTCTGTNCVDVAYAGGIMSILCHQS
jgi:hypothetical protein